MTRPLEQPQNRFRTFIATVLAGTCITTGFLITTASEAAPDKPNIVIIYADDMGYGDLAIQNPESRIPTPNLDQLASEGMLFTDGHSSSGICTPSRYALLTGSHHWRKFHGIVNSFGSSVFDSEQLTLPEMLQQSGYTTACIGKWHLGMDWSAVMKPGKELPESSRIEVPASDIDWSKPVPDGPTDHGFDYYFGDGTPNFPPYGWMENDRMLVAPTVPFVPQEVPEGSAECRKGPAVEGWRLDAVMPKLTEKAVEWIGSRKDSDKPFFLYFPWTSPHAPIVPTEEFVGKSQAGPYGDYVVQSDWTAGQVIKALKDNGFYEDTVIIFTADNGAENYMMERYLKYAHNSSGPLRGMKRDIYEGGHHVPFVVKWPGVTEAGTRSNAIISQVDLMATIASAVGYDVPRGQAIDSIDMLPVLKREASSIRNSLVLNTHNNQYGIRHDDWVLLKDTSLRLNKTRWTASDAYLAANDFIPEDKDEALYYLKDDLGQRRNLIDEYPSKKNQLEELLMKVREGQYPDKSK